MLFYKVVELKQKSFARGHMTSSDLQFAINQWANVGWTLDRITSAETQGFLHAKDVFLLIFKRDVEIPEGLHLNIDNQVIAAGNQEIVMLRQQSKINGMTPATKKGMNGWETLARVAPDLAIAISTQ